MNDFPQPVLDVDRCPLILAGPVLRRVSTMDVTVWVATKAATQVSLQIYKTSDSGQSLSDLVATVQGQTLAVGQYLHVVAITAHFTLGYHLQPGEIYAYELGFILEGRSLDLAAALHAPGYPPISISYFHHQRPTFLLPPSDLSAVQIVHGSCRKPHGRGQDSLVILDELLAHQAQIPSARPQQLFLTGDQIYGDDVAAPFLWVATYVGELLLGWQEKLPVGSWRGRSYLLLTDLPSGERADVVTQLGGFTAGLHHKRAKVKSHLLGLGEYCAAYLLAYSPTVWPPSLPRAADVGCEQMMVAQWDREVVALKNFWQSLHQVRRAIANIATYTIFDDHDVSDDWNLNQSWCLGVLGQPLGRRVVSNALLAYSVFQAWGNTPKQFAPGSKGSKLWRSLEQLTIQGGYDSAIEREIAKYLGLPVCYSEHELPQFSHSGSDLVLKRDPEALDWHYTIDSGRYFVVVCDTRTQRGYPANGLPIDPARLLSLTALQAQVIEPLTELIRDDQELVIVLSTNLFGLQWVDWIHHHQLQRGQAFATDAGDAWNMRLDALAQFLQIICNRRQRVLILTGDIHYAGAMEFTRVTNSGDITQVVQFTASSCKNEEILTRILQSKLKSWLWPERDRICRESQLSPGLSWQSSWSRWCKVSDGHPRWQGRLRLLRHHSITTAFPATVQGGWVRQLYQGLVHFLGNGREVIGCNNIAIVGWEYSPTTDNYGAVQDVYWYGHRIPQHGYGVILIARYHCAAVD